MGAAGVNIKRVGEFRLGWGESLFWDDRRDRLYFVDCAASTLHWLDGWGGAGGGGDVGDGGGGDAGDGGGGDAGGGEGGDPDDLATWKLPSMPTGLVPAEDGRLVVALEDGLYTVDVDSRLCDLLTRYPSELEGRANDACADLAGNLITGKLNLTAAPGSAWRYSPAGEWKLIDPDISNTNGPAVAVMDGEMTLIVGDTATDYFSYPYDAIAGEVGPRRVFGDVSALDGSPDGSSVDADGGLWCALVGGGQLARFTDRGLDQVLPLPVTNPTDVTFGGPDLDRLFVVSIGMGAEEGSLDGALLVIDGLGRKGRVEPRFAASKGTVVVIDDEKSVVNLLRSILEMDGYVVYQALTGELGLGAVEAVNPDVVVLDVMMPFMDGIEVCRRLKESRPELPIVILTARDDHSLESRCYEAGADHYMKKPLLPGQLSDVVAGLRAASR